MYAPDELTHTPYALTRLHRHWRRDPMQTPWTLVSPHEAFNVGAKALGASSWHIMDAPVQHAHLLLKVVILEKKFKKFIILELILKILIILKKSSHEL